MISFTMMYHLPGDIPGMIPWLRWVGYEGLDVGKKRSGLFPALTRET
jgi:hypothetical protein